MEVLDQLGYNRTEARDESAGHESRKIWLVEEKESFRWLETLERSTADIPEGVKMITVCDREGDMYELFAKAQLLKGPILIRVVQNRMTVENKRILDEIRKKRCQGRVDVRLPRDSRNSIPERDAVLQLRYASYPVKRTHILNPVKTLPDAIDLQVIYVKEEKPPKGKEGIERFHYVLKSGCGIEKLQERSIDKTMILILMYSIIAVMILNMT